MDGISPVTNASPTDLQFWCASELLVGQIPDDLALFLRAHGEPATADHRYALIVVNTPLCRRDSFEMLWKKCAVQLWNFGRSREMGG